MDEKSQNSCIIVTGIDEDTGKTKLMYIPLNVDWSVVEFFLEKGTCTNKNAVSFDLECTGDEFWTGMWKELESTCD